MNYGPIVRIILRYVVGGLIMGSQAAGDALAADPDIVIAGAALLGMAVEGFYMLANRKGWAK
ncbi:hypothetical protein [Cognatishimia sp. MH4019]|uniref:hypothetical protein n=1 Tax=Cognatishimia sp. MH4019 TaxID=2854030 RepID=UPI001CD264DC|nr:hypothetical protein [Cognatishimia sp. MH4019]